MTQSLSAATSRDIKSQVDKVLRGLDWPEPPLRLDDVRELLRLDRQYYSSGDDSVLAAVASRLRVAGRQVLQRPTLLAEAIRSWNLKALYLPDQRRILIDETLPPLKHRWNEAHEIGHEIIPWHAGAMLGDTERTLTVDCRTQIEAEANFAAGNLLFLGERFADEANSNPPALERVLELSRAFSNTITSTLWRYVEQAHPTKPMLALVGPHPHMARRKDSFDPLLPFRHTVESPSFTQQFGHIGDVTLWQALTSYCGAQRGGMLGSAEMVLKDLRGDSHLFAFETFFNGHDALTLATWQRRLGA